MSEARDFRRWAAQVARQAGEEPDANEAQRLLSIAEYWVRLAEMEIGSATGPVGTPRTSEASEPHAIFLHGCCCNRRARPQFNAPKWITNLCGNLAAARVVPAMLTPCRYAASAPGR